MRTVEDIPTARTGSGAGNTSAALAGATLAAPGHRTTAWHDEVAGLHGRLLRLLRLTHRLAARVDDPEHGLAATRRHTEVQLAELHHRCDTLAARVDDLEGERAETLRRAERAEAARDTYARLWARLHTELDTQRGKSGMQAPPRPTPRTWRNGDSEPGGDVHRVLDTHDGEWNRIGTNHYAQAVWRHDGDSGPVKRAWPALVWQYGPLTDATEHNSDGRAAA